MSSPGRHCSRLALFAGALIGGLVVAGCATTTSTPTPRTIVIYSGARLTASPERMEVVAAWVQDEMTNIQEDPTFLIQTIFHRDIVYPWEKLELVADTAKVGIQGRAADAQTPYLIYAHLHLMKEMGRVEEWLPGAGEFDEFQLERAILARVSDVWLYGRTVFDAAPHLPLEELIYANENGYLDAFIFTARPDEFAEAYEEWQSDRPGEQAAYIAWFQETFQDQPPGLRPPTLAPESAAPDSTAFADTTGTRLR
jgi:hypothetical protein